MNKKNMNLGAAILFLAFGLLFFVLLIRFVTIQYTGEAEGRVLAAKAAKLYLRQDVIKAKRGTIYDQNGAVIAEDTSSYTLIAILDEKMTTDPEHPRHVVDPQYTARELSKLIDMDEHEIYQRLTLKGFQVEFGRAGRDLPHNVKKKIEKMKLPGITFMKDTKRFYPNGIFASHLIGYAKKDEKNPEIQGIAGLEKSYQELLKGKDGTLKYEGDIWNYILPNAKKQVVEPENGHDLYLTIDKKIQTFLEDAMSSVDEKYKPKKMMAIVADPKTGKILAMGQRPTYHPDTREGIEKSWHNENIETTFEPGSTMKVFSLAAAVESNAFDPNAYFESGKYYVDQKSPPIKDANYGRGWGSISFLEGVQRSSNVGFAKLLERMGTETWREYMDRFKLGQPTGIDLPGEAPGKILYDWPIEKVTSVFGQGTTVTAMQMVQGMTAIANDGVMMKPYVVEKIVDPNDESVKEKKPEKAGQPISKETAKKVREILETVMLPPHGTGQIYQLEGYKVSGKTGTAQLPNPNGGGYMTGWNNYLFSVLGMAPADDPKIIMYVAIEQPNLAENENGSVPVSEIFKPVMQNSLKYLNIQPDETPEPNISKLADFSGKGTESAKGQLGENGLTPVIVGSGNKIISQLPKAGTAVIEGERVLLRTEGEITAPDMAGWSKRDVLKFAEISGLKVNMLGSGYAYKQNFQPGSTVAEGGSLVVNFETPEEKLNREKQLPEEEGNEKEPPPLD